MMHIPSLTRYSNAKWLAPILGGLAIILMSADVRASGHDDLSEFNLCSPCDNVSNFQCGWILSTYIGICCSGTGGGGSASCWGGSSYIVTCNNGGYCECNNQNNECDYERLPE